MGLTTRSCRLGDTISARMKRWRLSGSTAGCVIGLPAFADAPVLCRKRSRWSTPPSHCLPPTTSIEQRQNSPCHCFLNTLEPCDTECLFNTPSLGQQDETLGELRAADDLDCDVQARHRGFEPPGIGAVG